MYQNVISPSTDSLQLEPYRKNPKFHEILHIKCPVIKLVHFQMVHVDTRLAETLSECKKRQTLSYKIWKSRWMLTSCLLTVILMGSLFLYGTLVGAGMCSAGQWSPSFNAPCPKTFSFLPGINLAKGPPLLAF